MTNKSDDDPAVEVSSPACLMHEADDAYMGFAGRDEVHAFLNGLLEAERAGARVTLETARAADTRPISPSRARLRPAPGKRDAQPVAPMVINSCFGGDKSRSGARQDTRWNDRSPTQLGRCPRPRQGLLRS